MNVLLMILRTILKIILPDSIYKEVLIRVNRSKKIFLCTKELKQFFSVLLYLVNLVSYLLIAIFKMPLVWLLPMGAYNALKYLSNQFYSDICSRNLGLVISFKRAILFLQLVYFGREKKASYGSKNPDKTFFVIRPYYFMEKNALATSLSNLLFHYYRNLQHLSYALEHNWIPVVDWKNYGPFPHQEDFPVNNTVNCWEYYWNQPSEYTLEEVYQSKNVILSSRNSVNYGFIPTSFIQNNFIVYAKELIKKCPKYDKHIVTNEYVNKYVSDRERELFPSNARILGVSVRGASYGLDKVPGHPKQPTVYELVDAIKKYMKEWKLEYIFFACESQNIIDVLKNEFGTKLITVPRLRYTKIPGQVYDGELYNPLYEPGNKYQSNLDYLTEMILLSRCDSLLAGMSGGVRMAVVWNGGKYTNMKFFEKGLW